MRITCYLPTCNYDRFHRTLKSVARSWQSVSRSRVACRSRSAMAQILYPDVGDLSESFAPAVKIHNRDIDPTDRHCDKKTRAEHLFLLFQTIKNLDISLCGYIYIFALRIVRFFHYFSIIIKCTYMNILISNIKWIIYVKEDTWHSFILGINNFFYINVHI